MPDREGNLTAKEEAFALALAQSGDRRRAAMAAGYAESSAGMMAARMMACEAVRSRVEELRAEITRDAPVEMAEAVRLLGGHLRADLADIFPDEPLLQEAKRRGVSRYIKTFKRSPGKYGDRIEVQMHDWIASLNLLRELLGWQPSPGATRSSEDFAEVAQQTYQQLSKVFGAEAAREILTEQAPEAIQWLTAENNLLN
jgi:hypothetical protein